MHIKLAVITCYFDPQYVRGQVIRTALSGEPGITVVSLLNRRKGLLRYPEILAKLIALRLRDKPDAYLLTFRGQEILPAVLAVAGRRPVIFDEFIVPLAYATGESHRRSPAILVKHALARVSAPLYARWLRRCALILADTDQHAALSATTSDVPRDRYRTLPVGADERVFRLEQRPAADHDEFVVLYYGNMLPLHGLDTVLEAAVSLADRADIRFELIGGGAGVAELIDTARSQGARIRTRSWVPYDRLPAVIAASDLCLGGPFGGTPQAQNVVTGKTYQFLASGAPTVVGLNDASAEVFADGDTALIVPQKDAAALAETIIRAADDRHELLAIGRRGRELFERRFSTPVLGGELATWVRQVTPR